MKATHKGTCQACGSPQRLPNGKLSNHGYAVKWNMFQGTCQGSKELPYEKSCDLIKTFISRAQAQKRGFQNEIEELENYKGNLGWHKAYYNGEYSWNKIEIHQNDINTGIFRDWNNKLSYFLTYNYSGDTVAKVIKKMNQTRIDFYLRQMRELDKYVEWQEKRIKDWKEMDLYPIKGVKDSESN